MGLRSFGSDLAVELCDLLQLDAWPGRLKGPACDAAAPSRRVVCLRIENTYRHEQFLIDDPHGFGQVGIVRDYDQLIAIHAKGIGHHVGGDIHVRAFFFCFDNLGKARAAGRRRGQRHENLAFQIVALVHGEVGKRFEGANVDFLPHSDMRIGRARLYERREIPDAVERKAGQNLKAQLREVHPFVGRVLGGSVIEIEAININVRADCRNGKSAPEKSKAALRRLAPSLRRLRGCKRPLYEFRGQKAIVAVSSGFSGGYGRTAKFTVLEQRRGPRYSMS